MESVIVERCPDTRLSVGFVPEFPGAHPQGGSFDELMANLREVLQMLGEDHERCNRRDQWEIDGR
jgi:predicted RNase H-like HicB family nuclease